MYTTPPNAPAIQHVPPQAPHDPRKKPTLHIFVSRGSGKRAAETNRARRADRAISDLMHGPAIQRGNAAIDQISTHNACDRRRA